MEKAEEDELVYNQIQKNTLKEDIDKIEKKACFTNGVFILGDEGEIGTKRYFPDSTELTNFRDKIHT